MEKNMLARISRIAIAIAFSFVICSIAVGPARADDRRGESRREERRENRGRDYDRGGFYIAPAPDYYYTPQPNYYYAPEPEYYNYAPQPEYYPPPPSEGTHLFFGIF
jgi:Domain of unknwon function (DUF3824)